jgi:HK97 family phage prohead protease
MKKSIDQLLSALEGLVQQYGAMEAEVTFTSGDLVTYEGGMGTIESFDQDGNYAVRAMDENEDPTDEVISLTAEQMQKYPKPDKKQSEEVNESDDEEMLDEEEEQEYKSGDYVSFVSAEGVTYGQIIEANDNGYTVEVYAPIEQAYEPTGIEVVHDAKDLTAVNSIDVKQNPNKILAKFTEIKMDVGENNIGVIEGYASTFGNVDLGGDRVFKGAFNQTFMHKKTRKVFFDHFYGVPDLAGVGTFSIDEKGLYMRAEMPLEATDVRNAFVKIKFMLERDEDMGLSIGYNTVKSRMSAEGIRDLLELAVMETSITPFPMNTEALIMSAKSRKLGYQAKRQAWQTIVRKDSTDAPNGNQLNEGDIRSLIEDIKTIIHNQ